MKYGIQLLAAILILAPAASVYAQHSNTQQLSPPEQQFEDLWRAFDDQYALFEVKGVDWEALYRIYRPHVSATTTEEELFKVLTGMLGHLNDNHVILTATSLGRDFSAGHVGTYIADLGLGGAMAAPRAPLPSRWP